MLYLSQMINSLRIMTVDILGQILRFLMYKSLYQLISSLLSSFPWVEHSKYEMRGTVKDWANQQGDIYTLS